MRTGMKEEDRVVETWEALVPGLIYVWVWNRREDKYDKAYAGGNRKRLDISRDDRKYNQEIIPEENLHLDPFTNGSMRLVRCATPDENLSTRNQLTDAELEEYFKIVDEKLFSEAIREMTSEVLLRRLETISEKIGRITQVSVIKEAIRERFPVGGIQRSIREEPDVFNQQTALI